ncbi:MAG: LPS assembly protein LptD [Pseudomonadota bacterium]|nr:LPS assembly protein LptD [Pseudomonadota bacterium]
MACGGRTELSDRRGIGRWLATSALAAGVGVPFASAQTSTDLPALAVTSAANLPFTPDRIAAPVISTETLHDGRATIVLTDDPAGALTFAPLSEAAREKAILSGALPVNPAAAALLASAQPQEGSAQPAAFSQAAADEPTQGGEAAGEEEDEILFEADAVSRIDDASPIVAEGNVRAYFGGRMLRADKLSYDPAADIVIAEGDVSINDGPNQTTFAGRVELSGDLRDGIAENFSALLAQNAHLAADEAIQEQGARTRLNRAVYTACDVCKENGDGKTPTWRIKSLRVTRDLERKVVRFHHAFFEIKGVPVLYSPFLQAPDPSVERQSGFLTPVIGASSRLGFNFELPYYLALSNHQDATFSPKYTSNDGVLWQGEYRRRDVSGAHVLQAGFLNFDNTKPDNQGKIPTGVPSFRWHIFGKGYRDFGEHWQVGYDVERVSDDTYLRNYDIRRRGDLSKEIDTSSTNRLRSNGYVRWHDGSSEFRADNFVFQGLRADDDEGLTPYVLPLLNYRRDFAHAFGGGRAYINANFASLQRTDGADTRRFTASAYWNREHITQSGHRFNAFAEIRGDAFHYSDLDQGTETLPGAAGDTTRVEGRFAPTAGIEWSYPLTRRAGGARLFIEPRVQLVASPTNHNADDIINEDSQSIEFDYAGLFEYNKSTGYDVFEDGQRINAGVSASAIFDNGFAIETSIGAQLRAQSSDVFDPSTGLGEQRSDIVGSLNIRYKNIFSIDNRLRIDDDTGTLRRAESKALLNYGRFTGTVGYVRLEVDENAPRPECAPTVSSRQCQELTGMLRVKLNNRFSVGGNWRQDLEAGRSITRDFVLGYADECASLEIVYRRDFTRDVGLAPDTSVLIRFTLRSLVD